MGKEEEDGEVSLIREPLLNSIKGKEEEHSCPYSTANLYSILTFSWLNPLLDLGNKKTINLDDVPQLSRNDAAIGIYTIFKQKLLGTNTTGDGGEISSPKLLNALFWLTWREVLCTGLLSLVYICASFVGPYLIDFFVQYLNGDVPAAQLGFNGRELGYVLASAFVLSKIVESLSTRHLSFKLEVIGIRVKNVLVAIIYDKLLTLSNQSRRDSSSGEIVNLMSVDADNVSYFSEYIHDCWKVPLQVILALLLLYRNVGVASFAALLATVLVILVNISLGRLQGTLQRKLMESKDERMKATSETVRNMKILKLQGWEMKFLSKIVDLRKNEEGWLRKRFWKETSSTVSFHVSPIIVSAVTFFACMLTGIPLESGKVLSTIATVGILKDAIFDLPLLVSKFSKAKVSLYRVSCFLFQKDVQNNYIKELPSTSEVAIDIKSGSFSWSSSETPALKDVNLQVFNGMRVGVCGTVGSGKSSLLSCILGEMNHLSGEIKLRGRKAYVSQSPWIRCGNIEENILFGKEMDREKYAKVLEACSLEKDLDVLPFWDQTIIGERGINLSGGQKQRIQIARALYQDAEIYLFDDPFSALDAHTATHLYKECLLNFLKSKTVIYTTNQVELLPSADLILVLKEGKITQSGTYREILTSETDFMELVGAHKKALLGHQKSEPEIGALSSDIISKFDDETCIVEDSMHEEVLHEDNQAQLVQEEDRQKGRVSAEVYWKYITAANKGVFVPVIVLVQVAYQILQYLSDYWMASHTPVSKDVSSPIEASTLITYIGLASLSCLFVFARVAIVGIVGYMTATILFKDMHFSIFGAPMSFLDATPSGRILDRASEDQEEVDCYTSVMFGAFVTNTTRLVAIIGVMGQGGWQIYFIYVPVAFLCIWLQQYSITATRELGRLKGVSNAPLKQHFIESISGLTTIKCFDQDSRFMDTNMKLIDSSSRPQFYTVGATEWLGFRLDVLSSFTFALALVFLVSMPQGIINPAVAGLVVTYGLSLNALQAKLIWLIGLIERDIISVERLLQYTCIPSEAPLVVVEHRPDSNWPSHGEISVLNLKVRYAPHLPLILDRVTCAFRGGMKTGIVGRTGSGKSTLVQTLFRIVEPSDGKILIDGVDISLIGLHDLRSRLSIIPQDPTMFEGTVRSNLDPLEEYTDDQIWEALDKCKLGDEVRKQEKKLDSPVAENGENWSMGQRQLVCLSRVLLKKSKILVLDEATSSVDTATDTLMQETLRQHFSESTVIIIAHRITSVLNSDAVLVLDKGRVVEYGSPNTLLENDSSWFAKLIAEQVEASSA
ncbi:hypothetical protein MKX03_006570 [Papaver bracteatum]|nr:hypothetical protein MKX03_006570 [Papaver bracteatum]